VRSRLCPGTHTAISEYVVLLTSVDSACCYG
jgi:hypothetical protein